jgi:large subunit ribosomal protein L10
VNRDEKAAVIDEIAGQIKESDAVFAVDYRGITVPEAAALRARLRDADATFRIVKNSLTERAADKAGAESLRELLDGPTALTFVRGDAATAAKALADLQRETEALAFKGGLLGSEVLDALQITALSKLPTRDALYQQLVGMIASPLSGLAAGMGNLIGGLARQLGQIAEQGLVTGEAPAPAEETSSPEAEAPAPAEDAPAPETEDAPASEAEAPAEDAPAPEAEAPAEDAPASEAKAPAEEAPAPEPEAPAEDAPAEEAPAETAEEPAAEAETPEPESETTEEADAPADADQTDTDAAEAKED